MTMLGSKREGDSSQMGHQAPVNMPNNKPDENTENSEKSSVDNDLPFS